AGVPAVAAAHGAFVELIDDGVTGLLHRPGDATSLASCLRRVATDPAANREMGRAARRRYERGFSPAVGLERLEEGYRSAIAGRSGDGESPSPTGRASTGSRWGTRASRYGGTR
ncbi:glycosyltransferase family 4 protein, partial [Streptomyces sp. SID10115]|uniref:glycosyltransferase n=2 Tax=Streptomyces TaxID=1883 RepID=UPI0013C93C4A